MRAQAGTRRDATSLPHFVGVETMSAMTGEGDWCGNDSEGSMGAACIDCRDRDVRPGVRWNDNTQLHVRRFEDP
jgi:hypothetical protein